MSEKNDKVLTLHKGSKVLSDKESEELRDKQIDEFFDKIIPGLKKAANSDPRRTIRVALVIGFDKKDSNGYEFVFSSINYPSHRFTHTAEKIRFKSFCDDLLVAE